MNVLIITRRFISLVLIIVFSFYSFKSTANVSKEFLLIISDAIDETLYESEVNAINIVLSKALVVGSSYFIETRGMDGNTSCESSYNEGLINPQFIVFKYTGVGQTAIVRGVCNEYESFETMTVTGGSTLSLSTNGFSYNVSFRRVIKLK